MSTITETMSADHRRCDSLFTEAEALISKADWARGQTGFSAFQMAVERHLSMEEEVLFPALESRAGQKMGPVQVMRMEHAQIRQLLSDMQQSILRQDKQRYLGLSETLLIIMQQHNMKEENMLYPMADNALGDQTVTLQRLEQWNTD